MAQSHKWSLNVGALLADALSPPVGCPLKPSVALAISFARQKPLWPVAAGPTGCGPTALRSQDSQDPGPAPRTAGVQAQSAFGSVALP